MSNEIFKWCPHLLDNDFSSEFAIRKSEFELPLVQKRKISSRSKHTWKFNYKTRLFDNDSEVRKLQDEILDFFEARYGGYDNFYLPSFELEDKAVSYTTTSAVLNVDATKLGFSATAGKYGNVIYICNRLYTINGTTGYYDDIRQITTIGGTGNKTIYFTPAITTANYGTHPYIMKACKVNFVNDILTRSMKNPYAWEGDIEFVEDLSDSYNVVLPT